MFRSSYDNPQVNKSYHLHVLIVHRCFTVKRYGIPLCFLQCAYPYYILQLLEYIYNVWGLKYSS